MEKNSIIMGGAKSEQVHVHIYQTVSRSNGLHGDTWISSLLIFLVGSSLK